jgi:hypothetical protein
VVGSSLAAPSHDGWTDHRHDASRRSDRWFDRRTRTGTASRRTLTTRCYDEGAPDQSKRFWRTVWRINGQPLIQVAKMENIFAILAVVPSRSVRRPRSGSRRTRVPYCIREASGTRSLPRLLASRSNCSGSTTSTTRSRTRKPREHPAAIRPVRTRQPERRSSTTRLVPRSRRRRFRSPTSR